jgi:hypothetical protein
LLSAITERCRSFFPAVRSVRGSFFSFLYRRAVPAAAHLWFLLRDPIAVLLQATPPPPPALAMSPASAAVSPPVSRFNGRKRQQIPSLLGVREHHHTTDRVPCIPRSPRSAPAVVPRRIPGAAMPPFPCVSAAAPVVFSDPARQCSRLAPPFHLSERAGQPPSSLLCSTLPSIHNNSGTQRSTSLFDILKFVFYTFSIIGL